MKKIRIHLVEDHPCVKMALDALFQSSSYTISSHATSCGEARQMLQTEAMDLAILDLWLGDGSGEELIPAFLQQRPGLPILIFSAMEDLGVVSRCLLAGAKGFFPKPSSFHEILHALDTVFLQKSTYLPGRIRSQLSRNLSSSLMLTAQERQILSLIALSHSNPQIAKKLDLKVSVVAHQRSSIMKKLQLPDTAAITRYAISSGLLSPFEPLPHQM
jgi:DNA-binding NarL/FixJ family response regulator